MFHRKHSSNNITRNKNKKKILKDSRDMMPMDKNYEVERER